MGLILSPGQCCPATLKAPSLSWLVGLVGPGVLSEYITKQCQAVNNVPYDIFVKQKIPSLEGNNTQIEIHALLVMFLSLPSLCLMNLINPLKFCHSVQPLWGLYF